MSKRSKAINTVMNLPISLNGMLTHEHNTGGFGHFSLSFLEMDSIFTITSFCKCIMDLEELIVYLYGDLLYNSG